MNHPAHKTDLQNNTLTLRLSPSSFTGKERDEETGYGYFGARYMDYELTSMWLSVDPMSDKYPSISPYAYCAWNPVKLVDPDGQDISGIKPPRHGIRLEMGKFSAQIGLVAGIGFSAYSGVARDQVGIVQFKCAKGDVCAPNKTNSSRVGGDFSISKVFAFNYKCRKFEDILHRQFGGVSAGFGGFSFDNEGTRMYSFGLGITAIEDVTSFDITSSISVTWEQWDRYDMLIKMVDIPYFLWMRTKILKKSRWTEWSIL